MNLERTARDLCVLADWYTERPKGLTFRELGQRYGMSESGVHQIVYGARGGIAKLLWPVESSRVVGIKRGHIEMWDTRAVSMILGLLRERMEWTVQMMNFADDRRELARCAEATP